MSYKQTLPFEKEISNMSSEKINKKENSSVKYDRRNITEWRRGRSSEEDIKRIDTGMLIIR